MSAGKDPDLVREQLERILADPLFCNSKRYPSLLRYAIEQKLAGRTELLKERNLGIEVFGRRLDYDTSIEPIVRTTAVEIRKRLAQYYSQQGREQEIRIELPVGSYVPEFHSPVALNSPLEAPAEILPPATARSAKMLSRRWPIYLAVLAGIAMAAAAFWKIQTGVAESSLDKFWAPVLQNANGILLCIGGANAAEAPGMVAAPSQAQLSTWHVWKTERVALSDATALVSLSGYLKVHGKPYVIRPHMATSFIDLRNSPSVLVGAFNNRWTMRLTSGFRYSLHSEHLQGSSEFVNWIEDSEEPGRILWKVDSSQPYSSLVRDYAIVSRVIDRNTQRPVVIAAGLMNWGTVAAGEFLSEKRYMEDAMRSAPSDWNQKNVEIVLGTTVFNGVSGPPEVLARVFW